MISTLLYNFTRCCNTSLVMFSIVNKRSNKWNVITLSGSNDFLHLDPVGQLLLFLALKGCDMKTFKQHISNNLRKEYTKSCAPRRIRRFVPSNIYSTTSRIP